MGIARSHIGPAPAPENFGYGNVPANKIVKIPTNQQMIVEEEIFITGELFVCGELIVFKAVTTNLDGRDYLRYPFVIASMGGFSVA